MSIDSMYDSGDVNLVIRWFVEPDRGGMIVGDPRWICVVECITTGMWAASWQEKSRMKNKSKALDMLKMKMGGAI